MILKKEKMLRQRSFLLFIALIICLFAVEARSTRNKHKNEEEEEKRTTNKEEEEEEELQHLELPVQDVNFLILTDIHSSVDGNGRREEGSGEDDDDEDFNFGDVLSYYQRLKGYFNEEGEKKDLWFVMNGGFVHGSTMLGGQDPPKALIGTLEHMPYDLVSLGIDEVQSSKTVDLLQEPGGLIDWWGPNLVTSNILVNSTEHHLGYKYKILKGNAATILSLGFLIEDEEEDLRLSNSLVHKRIEETLKESWLHELLKRGSNDDEFDMILILASQINNVQTSILMTIVHRIREVVGKTMPIQIITGGNSEKVSLLVDKHSYFVRSGEYLDTMGFVSFSTTNKKFEHKFIDTNKKSFRESLGKDEDYMTTDGKVLAEYIERTVKSIGGDEIIGCSPRRYRADESVKEDDSLLRLYLNRVVSEGLLQHLDDNKKKDDEDDDKDENILEKAGDVAGKVVEGAVEKIEEFADGVKEKVEEIIGDDSEDVEKKNSPNNHNNIFIQRVNGFLRDDLYEGVITTNNVYGIVSNEGDDTIQKIGHKIKGDMIERLQDHLSSSYSHNTDIELKSKTEYDLYAPASEASRMIAFLKDHDAKGIMDDSNELVKDEKDRPITLRQVWINFIQNEWTYDDDEETCKESSTSRTKSSSSSKDESSTPRTKSSSKDEVEHATTTSSSSHNKEHKEEEEEELHTSNNKEEEEEKENGGHFPWFLVALGCLIFSVRKYKDHLPHLPPIPGMNQLSYNQPYGGNNVFSNMTSKFKDNAHAFVPSVNFSKFNPSSSFAASSYQDQQPQQQQQQQQNNEADWIKQQQQQQVQFANDGLQGTQFTV